MRGLWKSSPNNRHIGFQVLLQRRTCSHLRFPQRLWFVSNTIGSGQMRGESEFTAAEPATTPALAIAVVLRNLRRLCLFMTFRDPVRDSAPAAKTVLRIDS